MAFESERTYDQTMDGSAASHNDADRLEIVAYSDYVCPWCYIGHLRIERLRRELAVDVRWRPFELHPETPRGGAQLEGRLGGEARARAYRENIGGLAAEAGVRMSMPPLIANSHLALEAAEFARETDVFEPFHDALFRAYFENGLNIGEVDVLCEIARESGVDDQGLRQALSDERYAVSIDRLTAEARNDEIFSTPTFVFSGGFRLIGAQEYAVFASVTRRLMERRCGGSGAPG